MKVNYASLLILLVASGVVAQNKTNKQDSLNISKNGKLQKLESFKADTLSFIKENFVNHKEAYLHKPLGDLLSDIQLPVVDYIIGYSAKAFPAESPYMRLYFENQIVGDRKVSRKIEPLLIIIKWNIPLPLAEVDALMKRNNYRWTKEVQDYYSNQIVGDITMVDWRFNK